MIRLLFLTISCTLSVTWAQACMDSEEDQSLPLAAKETMIIKFDKSVKKLNYKALLEENADHPLVQASHEFLQKHNSKPEFSDLEHNIAIVNQGLSPHYGSRVNNVVRLDVFRTLKKTFPHSVNNSFPMNQRIVNFLNLYQLKTGQNNGCYLGANVFEFTSELSRDGEQRYIATEAPYDKSDYYRMIIDTNARVLVSVTTDKDDGPSGAFPKIREGLRVDLHHLGENEELDVDEYRVKEEGTLIKKFISGKSISVKRIVIIKDQSKRTLSHIIYRDWPDGGLGNSGEEIADLIKTIIQCETETASNANNPIVVNCGYGYGRTAIVILMHKIATLIPKDLSNHDCSKISVDMGPMLLAIEGKIAEGSPIGLKDEGSEKRASDLKLLAEDMIRKIVSH